MDKVIKLTKIFLKNSFSRYGCLEWEFLQNLKVKF